MNPFYRWVLRRLRLRVDRALGIPPPLTRRDRQWLYLGINPYGGALPCGCDPARNVHCFDHARALTEGEMFGCVRCGLAWWDCVCLNDQP